MELLKKESELGKVYLKRYANPLKISKRINDIESKLNKIYKNFYLSAADVKKLKELEEYQKNEQYLKNKYKLFIKLMKIEFKRKINLKELYPLKSAKNKESQNIYFNIIVNHNYKNQPYLQPIRGRDIAKYYSRTEPNIIGVKKKIRNKNKKLTSFILANKKIIKSYKMKKDFKYRNKNDSIIQFKNSLKFKYRDIFKTKNKSNINLIKSINIHSADLKNNINKLENVKSSSRNIMRKINLFNDNKNNSENRNYENILSPININAVHEQNFLSNDNQDSNLEKIFSPINNVNEIQDENNTNLYLNLNLTEDKNLFNKFKNLYLSKSSSLRSINSNSTSKNNKEIKSHRNESVKNSIESFKSKTYLYKNKKNLFINRRTNSINDHKMKAFKLLNKLNKSFYSTMYLSNKIKKNIIIYKKEIKYQTKRSKKETSNITRLYFKEIKSPSIKSSLKLNKERSWPKREDIKLLFNFKYNYSKKEKSPLTFVQEYNKLRNRRRKNNNKITENIGYRISPYLEIKKKELNSCFGLSFKNKKY